MKLHEEKRKESFFHNASSSEHKRLKSICGKTCKITYEINEWVYAFRTCNHLAAVMVVLEKLVQTWKFGIEKKMYRKLDDVQQTEESA